MVDDFDIVSTSSERFWDTITTLTLKQIEGACELSIMGAQSALKYELTLHTRFLNLGLPDLPIESGDRPIPSR